MIRAQKHSDSSDATVQCLSVTFDLALDHRQIAQWRGAFVEMAGREFPLLHNHQEKVIPIRRCNSIFKWTMFGIG